MSNSDNPLIGATFQRQVRDYFSEKYGRDFILEKKIPIGHPEKEHTFDIVDCDSKIAIECKRYTWTKTGNVPSAKMGFCNEAVFYLSFLPDTYTKYLVMLESRHEKHQETLAEYYFRMNRHLLGKTIVAEYNPVTNKLRIVGSNDI